MSEMADEDYEWTPPSEAELKILQARRERSDQISKLMGDYLLKGYKMLGITCPECSTILLQDKHGGNYCIACQELDTDTCKDDPALSSSAAESQLRERTIQDTEDTDDLSFMRQEPAPIIIPQAIGTLPTSVPLVTSSVAVGQSGAGKIDSNFAQTADALSQKIQWASQELQRSSSVEYSSALCLLIKNAADAIQSLKVAS